MNKVTYETLFSQRQGKKLIIQGHRGGFAPGNTPANFQEAVENDVKSVELDVWLTKDKQLVVLHGGDSGEIDFHPLEEQAQQTTYLFDLTLAEIRTTEISFVIPTLREVIEIVDKRSFINIEMKNPVEVNPRNRYDAEEAASYVHALIQETDLKDYCLISSFNHGNLVLPAINALNETSNYHVRTILLCNFYNDVPVPPLELLVTQAGGVNISYEHLTEEVVTYMHAHNKLVSVWIDREVTTETEEVHKRMINLGVDVFCSDEPLALRKVVNSLYIENDLEEALNASDLTNNTNSLKPVESRERIISFGLMDDEEFQEVEDNMKEMLIM